MEDVVVNGTPPPSPSEEVPTPGPGMIPQAPLQPADPGLSAGLTPPDPAGGAVARKPSLFSKLAGTDVNYTIDPTTGATVPIRTPQKPGQMFKNILAAGLMAENDIGLQSGAHNFAQGLIQGVGKGYGTAYQQGQAEDDKRRTQALQQYKDQMEAQRNQRENKESAARLDLNKVQIAHENMQTAVQQQVLYDHLRDNQDRAATFAQEADQKVVDDYKSLDIPPVTGLTNMTGDDMQKYLTNNPGASAKYKAAVTGKRMTVGPDGTPHVENLFSAYPIMNKVPPTLLAEMKANHWDDPKNKQFYPVYQKMAKGGDVNYTDIAAVRNQLKSWDDVQDRTNKQLDSQARRAQEYASAAAADAETSLRKDQLLTEQDARATTKAFNQRVNLSDGTVNTEGLSEVQKGDMKALINGVIQNANKELLQYDKPHKTANGGYVYDDPQAQAVVGVRNNLQKGLDQLNGVTPAPKAPAPPSIGSLSPAQTQATMQQVKVLAQQGKSRPQIEANIKQAFPQDADAVLQYLDQQKALPPPPVDIFQHQGMKPFKEIGEQLLNRIK